ncbi:MAG: hypothetical protein GSR78_04050 [Desulfurococcales archaeon]|nr:hypothetical protein [Desulfurococcales archaeon]
MTRVRVVVEAEVRATEDPEKVKKAVLNIMDPDRIEIADAGSSKILVAEAHSLRSLEKLHRLLRQERILDAARGAMRKGIQPGRLVFHLHKQAAYVGRLSFVGGDQESPMGAIRVTIEHPEPRSVIDWLAPPTVRGRPVYEKPMPE